MSRAWVRRRRRVTGGGSGITILAMTGLTSARGTSEARIGNHAAISVGFPVGVTAWTAQAWGVGSYGDSTYGTGANPTDYTASDGLSLLWQGLGDDGNTYRASAPVRYAPATGGADLDLSFVAGVAISATDLAANWTTTNLTMTWAVTGLPTGLSVNSSTASMTGTPATQTLDATYQLVGTDQYGWAVSDDFTLEITAAVTAPLLSGFSITDDGGGDGSMALGTDKACTIYGWIGPTGTTPTDTETRNGTGANGTFSQAVTVGGGPYSITLPAGLNGNYRVSVVGQDGAGPLSNVVTQSPIAFDTLAATLSSPTATQTGQTTADWGVTSNEAGGTIYAGVRPSGDAAITAGQLQAQTGGTGVAWNTDATPTADANNGGSFTGLTASTEYIVDMVQVDANGNVSGVVSSAAFTTAAAASAPTFVALGTGGISTSPVALPSGWAEGDIFIAMVSANQNNAAPSAPSGWTLIGSYVSGTGGSIDVRTTLYWKVAGASESAPTFNAIFAAQIMAVRGGTSLSFLSSGGARNGSISLAGGSVAANSLIVAAVGTNVDGNQGITQIDAWSNADVTMTYRGGHMEVSFGVENTVEWGTGPFTAGGTIGTTTSTSVGTLQGWSGAILVVT